MSDSDIDDIVSVRNANNSTTAPCGGNWLVNSHDNRIRRGQFSGNGSVANGNNDFGVGLINGSSGNLLEDNSIGREHERASDPGERSWKRVVH